jgi:O-antigen ligase
VLAGAGRGQSPESNAEKPVSRPSPAVFAGAVTAIFVASWVPVLVGVTTRAAFGWVVALALAVVVAWLTRRLGSTVLVTGFVVSSALVPSVLVTESTHYMPVAVTGGALALRVALEARQRGLPALPPMPIVITVGLYLAWATIATATSIDHRVSVVYLVGMVAVLALAFWIIPADLSQESDRARLLAAVGVLGVVGALSVYFVSVTGKLTVFGRVTGLYQVVDLSIRGKPTGIHFGYSSGFFQAPLESSVLMAIGIVALLGWSSARSRRDSGLAWIAIIFMIPAILLTLDRSAWLAATVGAGAFAALAYPARLRVAAGGLVFAFFAAFFLLVFANYIGANTIPVACTANCAAATDETPIRGGTGLSGRDYLWRASADAIKHRPLLGYGPGNDVQAIDPYLSNDAKRAGYNLAGLTSHSTWFRTAVEMGIPGLLFLIAIGVAVAWVFVRRSVSARALPDATRIAFGAAACGLLPAMTFETFLLGGVTFSSLFLAVAAGLAVGPETGDLALDRP